MNHSYDASFRDAVYSAARCLRTKPNIDPEIEGKPLAEMLCSNAPLDVEGLELLAQMATGNLRKTSRPHATESELARAVRRAGLAWRRGKDYIPEADGAALAKVLRGPLKSIGPGERALLALWVTGELRKGQHRPAVGMAHPQVNAVYDAYRERKRAGELHKNILESIKTEFKISPRTVARYIALGKELEKILKAEGEKYTAIKSADQ